MKVKKEPTKEISKTISFRVDADTDKKISMLEKTQKKSKSTIIKTAIEDTYSNQIISTIQGKLFEICKSVFDKIKIEEHSLMKEIADDTNEDRVPFPRETGYFRSEIQYLLDYPEYEDKNKTSYCLDMLKIVISREGDESLKVKISSDEIISGHHDKINSELFLNVCQIASKYGLQTETKSDKESMYLNIFFERTASLDVGRWSKKAKRNMDKIKIALNEINGKFSSDTSLIKKKNKK